MNTLRNHQARPRNVGVFTCPALLVAALALGASGCKQAAPPAPPPPNVTVLTITATNATLTTEFIGQLDSPQNVEVRARVEAFVDKMLFIEGTEVKEGDPLFLLDKKPFLERLAAANGMLAEAKATLDKYRADTNRLTPLARAKAIPQQDLDNAVASVAVGQASVQSAEARLESAKLDLSYCDVSAPVSGLIGAKQVSVGSLVGKGEPTLLATISTMDPIWFYCSIGEVDYLRAEEKVRETGRRVGDLPVTLIRADGKEHPDKGRWVFLDRAVDVQTGTIRARAEFPNTKTMNPDGTTNYVLRPGMFARVRIELKTEKDSLLVPQRALQELQGNNFVWVVAEGNQAARRRVELGPQIGSEVIILNGLEAGERIIVEGVQKVRDGEPVQARTAEQVAEAAAAQAAQQAETKPAQHGTSKHGKE
ncbi:MAG: efflux RND transporter periplasmic adaptor subunit [Verrucomicrobia bacterium]|nr:efflux RND transporter periplasmic adaptor subunit [Verrucomicrobiota bacterium]